jgi:hypothetical protein
MTKTVEQKILDGRDEGSRNSRKRQASTPAQKYHAAGLANIISRPNLSYRLSRWLDTASLILVNIRQILPLRTRYG